MGTRTALLPGKGDAAVLWIKGTRLGVAAKVDQNPRYSRLHPRLGAMHALAEACRNVSVVGAKPLAYTDGLNLGSPETPEGYHELAETIAGLKEASEALGVPVVSGNVSLYNESGGKRIPPTAMVGVVGVLEVDKRAEMGFRRPGEVLLLIGEERGSLGRARSSTSSRERSSATPQGLTSGGKRRCRRRSGTSSKGASPERPTTWRKGASSGPRRDDLPLRGGGHGGSAGGGPRALFGEAPSRVLFTVEKTRLQEATLLLEERGLPYRVLGETGGKSLTVLTPGGVLEWSLEELLSAWKAPLREVLDG